MNSGKVASSLVQYPIHSTYTLYYLYTVHDREPGVLNLNNVEITFCFPSLIMYACTSMLKDSE